VFIKFEFQHKRWATEESVFSRYGRTMGI